MPDDNLFKEDAKTDLTKDESNSGGHTHNQSEQEVLAQLVGEGKKFKDAEALARGKMESDNFIESLKRQMDEMRTELNQRLTMEEVLKQIEARHQSSSPAPQGDGENDNGNRSVELSQQDIQKLVDETIRNKEVLNTQKANLTSVKNELIKHYGSDYVSKLRMRLAELDVGEDWANGLAATQPKAFLRLVMDTPAPKVGGDGSPPETRMRPNQQVQSHRTYSDYQRMRKDDPESYFSKTVQMQMHKDAMELGESFYN